jgi:spermidine synthase
MEHPSGKHPKYFIIVFLTFLLIGYLGGHYFLLANYYFTKHVFFRIIILVSLFAGSWTGSFINRKLNVTVFTTIRQLFILMGLFTFLLIHFIYYIRPLTQYTTIFIFVGGFMTGIFAGIIYSETYKYFKANKKSEWKVHLTIILFLIAGYWIPVFLNTDLSIALCSLLFILAGILFFTDQNIIPGSWKELGSNVIPGLIMITGIYAIYEPIILFDAQERFEDKVVYSRDTGKHEVTITRWKEHYWVYIDGLKHLSTIDDYLFYEPFILPITGMLPEVREVLILGGENGCAVREILKYKEVKKVTLIPYDPGFLTVCQNHPILTELNNKALSDRRVHIYKDDILEFITSTKNQFDLIILDLPDPRNIETNQFYTREFYGFCTDLIHPDGFIITQSGSPYFTFEAFSSIEATMNSVGINTLPLHNQILTLGEWSWIIGSRHEISDHLKIKIKNLELEKIPTKWLNKEALSMIVSFGKEYKKTDSIEINTLNNPVVYQFYLKGTWDLD